MGKTGRWLRSLLTGKREKEKEKVKGGNQPATLPNEERSAPIPVGKEKRRWSFRRSTRAAKDVNSADPIATPSIRGVSESGIDQKRHAMSMAVATAADADAVVAAAQAAVAVIHLTAALKGRSGAIEEASAIKIQSVFRSYLARKALCALKGLVKLQALVRGHLVRKQATATLHCIQALVTAQARARAQRIRMAGETQISQRQSIHRQSPQHPQFRQSCDIDRSGEENVKIVEMDHGESKGSLKSRNSYSATQSDRTDPKLSPYYGSSRVPSIIHPYQQLSPAPSALTDMSPRAGSGHFDEFALTPAQSSPQNLSPASKPDSTKAPFTRQYYTCSISHDNTFCPNYMANTESSRAKARSQSAPKQRPESCERQPSRRWSSLEGKTIPRSLRMQRSSSHVGETVNLYPWSIKLDKSSVSLKESECGSTSTIQTSRNYGRSPFAYEVYGNKYLIHSCLSTQI